MNRITAVTHDVNFEIVEITRTNAATGETKTRRYSWAARFTNASAARLSRAIDASNLHVLWARESNYYLIR